MAKYNGHRSWNAWNVSLWIYNDENMYFLALDLVRRHGKRRAAFKLAAALEGQRTPDGAKYNLTCIREALADME